MANVLLLAEHDNTTLNEATARAMSAAQKLGTVDVLVAGENCQDVATNASKLSGTNNVLLANDANFAHQLAEPFADLLIELAQNYDVLLAPATTTFKNIMPRVAALLDIAQISEIVEVVSPNTFVRPIYAGNALQKLSSDEPKMVITIRPTAFEIAPSDANAPIKTVESKPVNTKTKFISQSQADTDRIDLVSAKSIVSGGRAFGSKDKFDELLEPLAAKLGAAIGASRAAVDAGYAPNEWQVGQTGKVVAPDLYIAIGISGAIQHLAGMKDSKTIVAINSDEDAPITQMADFVLIADLFEAVPELTEKL